MNQALERVMTECNFTAQRLRRKLRAVIAQRVNQGEEPEAAASAMIDAYARYGKQGIKLFRRVDAAEFFETGLWLDSNRWHWDNVEIRRLREQAQASVGSYTPQ
jgi:hypothetical protein